MENNDVRYAKVLSTGFVEHTLTTDYKMFTYLMEDIEKNMNSTHGVVFVAKCHPALSCHCISVSRIIYLIRLAALQYVARYSCISS